MLKRKPIIALTFALLTSWAWVPVSCFAADGSLDSMWNDQTPGKGSERASAPLCTVESFKDSELIKTGAWLGVGPFRGDSNELVDANQNKITVSLNKNHIIGAQFSLADKPNDMLKLQMSADFLLESLGARPARIADFNTQLDGASAQLHASNSSNPVNLSAGRYLVYIFPEHNGADNNFVIRVNSKDATQEVIKSTAHPATSTSESPGWNSAAPVPTKTTVTTSAPPNSTPTSENPAIATTLGTIHTTKLSSAEAPPAGDLKGQFADLINNWQQIKCAAVKDKDAAALITVLSGKALSKQTDAVKWLTDHKKHYENSAKNVIVDHLVEVAKDQKYTVSAQITETSKYIDEASGQVLKDTTDTYSVDYTVERINGKWYITDSAKVTPAAQTNKTQSKASR